MENDICKGLWNGQITSICTAWIIYNILYLKLLKKMSGSKLVHWTNWFSYEYCKRHSNMVYTKIHNWLLIVSKLKSKNKMPKYQQVLKVNYHKINIFDKIV